METFGQRFARLRKDRKLTQEEIANQVSVSPQAVSKWENDISYPDIALLTDLSEILKVSLDELMGKVNKQETAVVEKLARKDLNKLLLCINILSSDGDKVKVNLPVAIIKLCLEGGMQMPEISGNTALKNLDLKQIMDLIEQGVVGELISVETSDGDYITITVE